MRQWQQRVNAPVLRVDEVGGRRCGSSAVATLPRGGPSPPAPRGGAQPPARALLHRRRSWELQHLTRHERRTPRARSAPGCGRSRRARLRRRPPMRRWTTACRRAPRPHCSTPARADPLAPSPEQRAQPGAERHSPHSASTTASRRARRVSRRREAAPSPGATTRRPAPGRRPALTDSRGAGRGRTGLPVRRDGRPPPSRAPARRPAPAAGGAALAGGPRHEPGAPRGVHLLVELQYGLPHATHDPSSRP